MGVFAAIFGRRGDGGFTLAHISGCGGVIGFKVGTWLCPVREKVRPARPGADASAKKFAQRAQKGQKLALYGVLGEFFRANDARGVALGEFCRATGLMSLVLGERCRATGIAGMPCDYR